MRVRIFSLLNLIVLQSICLRNAEAHKRDRYAGLPGDLYESIVDSLYDQAVNVTQQMKTNGEYIEISVIIQLLLRHDILVSNTIHYAYKLWLVGEQQIVIDYFPNAYKLLFNQDDVKIVNYKYNLPLKIDVDEDGDGDRLGWGEWLKVESRRLKWTFTPLWKDNRVIFKIKNLERNMFLKLAYKTDNIGDKEAFGNGIDNIDESRLTWSLVPLLHYKGLTFHIINQQFGLALKLAVTTDRYNDRQLYGHNGGFQNDPERYQWMILNV